MRHIRRSNPVELRIKWEKAVFRIDQIRPALYKLPGPEAGNADLADARVAAVCRLDVHGYKVQSRLPYPRVSARVFHPNSPAGIVSRPYQAEGETFLETGPCVYLILIVPLRRDFRS